MTGKAIPASWRDLSHAELLALLELCPTFFRPIDLLWAKYQAADARAQAAGRADDDAWKAERLAFDAYMKKRDSRILAAYEATQRRSKRTKSLERAARLEAERLYALWSATSEAEA